MQTTLCTMGQLLLTVAGDCMAHDAIHACGAVPISRLVNKQVAGSPIINCCVGVVSRVTKLDLRLPLLSKVRGP